MQTIRGKLLVIYGPNNIGKSTQVKLLAKHLIDENKQFLSIKYPMYHLQPTGSIINDVLRHGKEMDSYNFQKLYAQNRRDFQPVLKKVLNAGIYVVAEDYTGTGLAWGMTSGLSLTELMKVNKGLIEPDVTILLDGQRFSRAIEKGHRHEDAGIEVWRKNRQIHLDLAKKFGWQIVKVDGTPNQVHQKVWRIVAKSF